MKKQIFTAKSIIIAFCIFVMMFLLVEIYAYMYINNSKLKITDDISTSDSALIQKEFGISISPQAQITAFGYSTDLVVIRIEGVDDLPAFLTDTIHLELDAEDSKSLAKGIYSNIDNSNSSREDMYGTNRSAWSFLNSNYQTNPIDSSAITSFFLIDDKLVIEISKSRTTSENREAIKEIVGA